MDNWIVSGGTTHVFQILYDKAVMSKKVLEGVSAPIFEADGLRWCVEFFPSGFTIGEDEELYSGLFLHLLDIDKHAGVDTLFKIGLYRNAHVGVTDAFEKILEHKFSSAVPNWGNPFFIKKKTLEKLYASNGSFIVQCQIKVKKHCDASVEEENARIIPPSPSKPEGSVKMHGKASADLVIEALSVL